MYWFQKELRKEIDGITLGEWVKDHINDTHYVVIYKSIEKGYKNFTHSYGVNAIQVGDLEKIKDCKLEKVITVLDNDDSIDRYIVLID